MVFTLPAVEVNAPKGFAPAVTMNEELAGRIAQTHHQFGMLCELGLYDGLHDAQAIVFPLWWRHQLVAFLRCFVRSASAEHFAVGYISQLGRLEGRFGILISQPLPLEGTSVAVAEKAV